MTLLRNRLSLAALAATLCVSAPAASRAGALDVAEPQPTFTDLQGKPHTLAELRGHPAVVNFWATWCGPCKEEMPHLQRLADSYAAQGVRFVAVSLDAAGTHRAKIPTVLRQRSVSIPVWTGATERTLASLQLGEIVPATIILDEAGTPIGRIEGEARDKDVRSRLDWLLSGRAGKQPKAVQKNDWYVAIDRRT